MIRGRCAQPTSASGSKDTSKGFADDSKKGNAFVVVAVSSFTIVFVLSDDLGFPHVLWYSSLFPALTEEFMLRLQ